MRTLPIAVSLSFLLALPSCGEDVAESPDAGADLSDGSDAASDSAAEVSDDADTGRSDLGPDRAPDVPEEPPDRDHDGVPDELDLFPDDPCEATDMDEDGIGDAGDPDRDGDGVLDRWERRVGTSPNDPDDVPDALDSDADDVPDYMDPFPLDGDRWEDLDGDGLADDEDPDDDNDGVSDEEEEAAGSDPAGLIEAESCGFRHEAGWYAGDFHSHTTLQGGTEDMADWVAIHEYYADPRFLAAHPEYQGRALGFQVLTDHRTAAGAYDPDFHSEQLVLVPGEEVGGPQHGIATDILTSIHHDQWDVDSYDQVITRVLEQVRWQGGLMQVNHPTNPDIAWTTPTDDLDAIEVWNAPWGAIQAMTAADLEREQAGKGELNPYIGPAIEQVTTNANHQALRMWELMMTAGIRIPPTGGSDRHTLLPPASPTTWVWAERLTGHDIADGVRAGRTVITRHPGALWLEVSLRPEGAEQQHQVGDVVELAAGATATLHIEVEHGAGSVIQVVGAPLLPDPTPEALLEAPLADVIATHAIPDEAADPYTWEEELTLPVPGWVYVRILEPIRLEGLSDESVEVLENALDTLRAGITDTVDFAPALIPLINTQELLGSIPCQEENWTAREELNMECFLVDQRIPYTFLLPEPVSLVLNFWSGEAPEGDWAMGAITSAFYLQAPR